jgi:TonB family protein
LEAFAQADEQSAGASWEAVIGLAQTYIEIGRFREALAAARRALDRAPDPGSRSETHLQIGRSYFWGWARMDLEEGEALETAQEELRVAAELSGDSASPAYGLRAAALYQLGRKQEAGAILASYRGEQADGYDLAQEIRCFLKAEATSPPVNLKAAGDRGAEVVKPKKRRSPRPAYPAAARDKEEQGLVLVQAIIGTSGNVDCLRPVKGLPFGLTDAALSAVRRWKYDPATVDGKPVSVYYNVAVSFFLR